MDAEHIDNDEIILRRIPPPLSDNCRDSSHGGSRPTSQRMQLLKKDDRGLSCTRLLQTSPAKLLEQLKEQEKDPNGWGVCYLKVGAVRELGLDVIHCPEGNDDGHCEIRGKVDKKASKKLSKIARMLSPSQSSMEKEELIALLAKEGKSP